MGGVERTIQRSAPLRLVAVFIAALALLAILPYLPTLTHDFVDYDDTQYVTENDIVKQGLSARSIAWAFTTLTASNWHPLTWLSHMLDVEVWGLWAGGHHLTNVLLHALNTVLVFLVLRRLTSDAWRGALVAAVFAVHPLHVESVAWVAERKDVLSTCFGLLAILAYRRYVSAPSLARYLFMALLFALSLMSKPMLVTLPFVLLLLDDWPLERLRSSATVRRVVLEKLPLLAISVGASVITVIAQRSGGAMPTLERIGLGDRIVNATVAYGAYLYKMVWPANLAVIYPLPERWAAGVVLASLIALVTISAIVIVNARKRPFLLVGWLWFVGTLVPVIGLVQVGVQAWADRYMYVPMIGLLIMLVWSVKGPAIKVTPRTPAAQPRAPGQIIAVAAVGALLVLTALTWRQAARWKDTIVLFEHAVAVTQRNHVAHNILGAALRKRGRDEEARVHITAALELRWEYAAAHNNMGLLMFDAGDMIGAQTHFRHSVRFKPDATVWNNLGHAQLALGKLDDALASFEEALAMGLDSGELHAGLGTVLWNKGRFAEAEQHLAEAVNQRPDLLDARLTYGVALAARGEFDLAIAQFQAVLEQDAARDDARQLLDAARAQRESIPPRSMSDSL